MTIFRKGIIFALAALLLLSPVSSVSSDPTNKTKNEDLVHLQQFKIEFTRKDIQQTSYINGLLDISVNDDQTALNWESKLNVKYVFVKGGSNGHLYSYENGELSDTGLTAPLNKGGQHPEIGHAVFYYDEKPIELFENPVIGDGADPWIVKHTDGYYYYTQTTGDNITIWKSNTLSGLANAERKVVWKPEEGAPNSEHLWAPEIHFIDGKWYVYFAASAGDMGKQRSYVLESATSDPFSEYSYPEGTEDDYGQITDPTNKWAIDGTVLQHEGEMYFVWSGWEGDVNVSQQIYIAPMSNPWTISGERVELSRPEYDWEKVGEPYINEGPTVLKNESGDVFLIYSASGSWTNAYKYGMLTLTGDNPLDLEDWEKSSEPVFQQDPKAEIYGTGHGSFVKSPDGTEDWMIYHAAKFDGAGWNRNIRIQEFTWNEDGTPDFRKPVPTGSLLEAPSGEATGTLTPALPVGYNFEAENATVNKAKILETTSASNNQKVGMIDFEDSFVEFLTDVPAGDYTLQVRYSNGMGNTASHLLTVNGQNLGEVTYESFGWDSWRYAEKEIHIGDSPANIRLAKGTLFTEVDYIKLIPAEHEYKYEAEHAYLQNAAAISDLAASHNQAVALPAAESQLEYRIVVAEPGTYTIHATYQNNSDTSVKQKVLTNSQVAGIIEYSKTDKDEWNMATAEVELQAGVNTITLFSGDRNIALDFIKVNK